MLLVGGVSGQMGGAAGTAECCQSVTVSGTGSVTAQPDRATVHAAATVRADSAGEATQQLATRMTQLRTNLTEAGVERDAIQTTDFQVFQEREDNTSTYVARQSISMTLSNTSTVGQRIDTAVESGATEIYGVEYGLSADRRRTLRAQAIDLAVTDARGQADAVANSTDLTVQNAHSVSTGDGGGPILEARDDGGGTEIDASPVRVTASVTIQYNATSG
jgi:uncharacterized protein YggE